MTTACVGLQESQIFCLPCSYVPPRIVRISLSVLGIGICMGGITIGAIGLSSIPTSSLSFWLNRTITLIGRNGCIGLIFGSYVLGTLLTEVGKDPIHSNQLAHKDNISKMQNTVEIATRIPRITLSIILDIALLIPYGLFLIYHRFKPDCLLKDEDLQSDKQLIVLIHGTNSNAGTWEFGKPFLQNGRRTFIEINLEENGSVMNQRSRGIDDYAQSVIGQLSAIQTRSGHRPSLFLLGIQWEVL